MEATSGTPPAATTGAGRSRFPAGDSLRRRTARGTVINAGYLVAFYSLALARGFIAAAFLSPRQYGVWGVLAVALGTMLLLKQVGIGDKYIQQADRDQERAFQIAFTLEVSLTAVFTLLLVAALPVLAVIYGRSEVILPGLVLALAPLGIALQSPVWVFYRRMDFTRQRRLQAVDPVVAFLVTVALAVAGAGYWSLVVGTVAGCWAGAVVALAASPYRLAWRRDRASLREYASFSGPLFVAAVTPVVMAQVSLVAGQAVIGIGAVGVIVLAGSISDYTNRVDAIVTETLYPAICAVRDRVDLLLESFVKSNRLALMWGVPFGIGLTLFAPDLVRFGLGERWRVGVTLIQAFGAIAALNHIAFNWDAFFRARGRTGPIATWSLVSLAAFLASALPLLIVDGLNGYAIGMGITTVVSLIARAALLTRLLPGLRIFRHTLRAIGPTVPAVAFVLVARVAEPGSRTLAPALLELLGYIVVTALATVLLERELLGEVRGYLRQAGSAPTPAAASGASA